MRANPGTARPSLRKRWLGQAMRRLRVQRGMTLRYAAAHHGVESSVAGRFERGEELFRRDRVAALLDLYLVFDQSECDRLLRLAQDTWQPPFPQANLDTSSDDPSFVDLLWLEQRAERIRYYSTTLVPDLLQTTGYAQAVIRAEQPGADEEDVERQVSLLSQRQQVLHGTLLTRLQVVLADSVLQRLVGRAGVLDDQLRHLADASDGDRVEVRVLPAPAGYLPGMAASFILLDLPTPYPAVTCVPYLGGRLLLEGAEVEPYAAAFERLRAAATTPVPSPNQ